MCNFVDTTRTDTHLLWQKSTVYNPCCSCQVGRANSVHIDLWVVARIRRPWPESLACLWPWFVVTAMLHAIPSLPSWKHNNRGKQ